MQEEIKNENQTEQPINQAPARTQINKGLKITNIMLFCIICAIEIYALWCYGSTVSLLMAENLSSLAVIALLPIFLILTFIIFIFAIVMTVLYNNWKKYMLHLGLQVTVFDKFLRISGWIFTLVNVLAFFVIFLI